MTNFPTLDQVAASLARRVRRQLLTAEQNAADLAIADFDDALRAAESDLEKVAICDRWARFANDLKHHE